MKLALITDDGEIVEIYEENTSKEELEKEFDNWIRLQELETEFLAKPKPNVIQISGSSLEAVMQTQLQLFHHEIERKIRLEKSFRKMVADRSSSTWNNFKTAFLSGLRKGLNYLKNKFLKK